MCVCLNVMLGRRRGGWLRDEIACTEDDEALSLSLSLSLSVCLSVCLLCMSVRASPKGSRRCSGGGRGACPSQICKQTLGSEPQRPVVFAGFEK
mmetsp:Transcript_7280/g.14124  ORF Transcript_7280/g.14124 Transcript_7280/m.14124 type:complete len:94 (+) Transcript_7280:64-345(+)